MAVHIMRRTESALFLLATMLVFCFPATSAAAEGGAPAEVEDAEGVSYTDRIVTAAWPGFFYVQQDDRAYGIRVDFSVSVAPGDRVTVTGHLNTPDGERTLTASSVEITSHGNPLPQPLYIRIPDLAGGSLGNNPGLPDATTLYNVGLLVKASGRVAEMGDGWLRIENGGGSVKVLYDGPTPPKVGGWARVTGISSIDASGSSPIPLIRGTAVTGWPGWFPHNIVFVGDSLTDGLDASAPDKVFNKQLLGHAAGRIPGRADSVACGVWSERREHQQHACGDIGGRWRSPGYRCDPGRGHSAGGWLDRQCQAGDRRLPHALGEDSAHLLLRSLEPDRCARFASSRQH